MFLLFYFINKMCDEYIKNLKVKNLKVRNVKACNIGVVNLHADNGTIKNLNVCTLNGKTLCDNQYQNVTPNFQIVDYELNGEIVDPFTPGATPVQPSNVGGYNPTVWNSLWENTVDNLSNPDFGLAQRLQCGRLT